MNTHDDKRQQNKTQSVAKGLSQIPNSVESTFQFVDNRSEVLAQRKLQKIANNSSQLSQLKAFQDMANGQSTIQQRTQEIGDETHTQLKEKGIVDLQLIGSKSNLQRRAVIQRIVVMDDSQVDLGTIVDVYQILRNGIDQRVTMLSVLSSSDIRGEQLGLMGHGTHNSFAGKSGPELAIFLAQNGVTNSNPVIDILACDTGKAGFVDEFVKTLSKQGISTTVYANEGSGITLPDGYSHSVPQQTKEENQEYNKILATFDPEVQAGIVIAEQAKKEIAKVVELVNTKAISGQKGEQLLRGIFLEGGQKILAVSGKLFPKLYEYQSKILARDQSPNKGVRISPKK